jgi:hypothetical protein
MSSFESHDLLRSNQQVEESEPTSTKNSSRKNKSKTKKNKNSSKKTKTKKKTEEIEPALQDLTSGNTRRSVLRERSTNEQVQGSDENVVLEPNNTEQESGEPNKDNSTYPLINNKGSFIWNYLEKLPLSGKHKRYVK